MTTIISPTVVEQKRCGKCKQVKHADQFSSDKNTPTGLTSYCKACKKSNNLKHYLKGKYSFEFDGPPELLDDIRDDMSITEIKEIIKFYQN